jgi:uncharacterized protein (TIGR03086 family)
MRIEELHERCARIWVDQVESVVGGDWTRETPCAEWDVRALVNHVVGEEMWIRPLLQGLAISEVGDRLDGDLLGEDPGASANAASVDAIAAVNDLAGGIEIVHLSYGDESTETYLRQVSADLLIHTWDLATATGGDSRLPDDLVAEVAGWFVTWEDLYRGAGVVGERNLSDGTPQGDLLAAFGRHQG